MNDFRGPRAAVVLAILVAAACALTACGGKSAGSSPTSPVAVASSGGGGGGGGGAFGRPAASGQIAAIAGTTMQVQNPQDGQVAVSWTATTKFTDTVAATLASVRVGDCVTASSLSTSASTAPSGAPPSASTPAPNGPLTATQLTVAQPVNGQCGAGFAGGPRPSGAPTDRPSDFPTGTRTRPSGAPSGGFARRAGNVAAGTVVSVSGNTVVLDVRQPGGTTTTTRAVAVTSQTKITATKSSTAAALKVGRCVTAQGSTDSAGAVTATTVRVDDPVDGRCNGGFAGRAGGN